MCFQSPEFSKLLRDPGWAERFMFVVIDECHCVTQWGKKFRTTYSDVNRLRSFVAPNIPFLATSATLPPTSFTEICQLLEISTISGFHLNLGNDRTNIMPIIWPLRAAAKDLNSLNFIVTGRSSLPRTIIYTNTKELARVGCEHLRTKVALEQRSQIDFIHASRSLWPQRRILELFQNGKIHILFATEVVGMVCARIIKSKIQGMTFHTGHGSKGCYSCGSIHGPQYSVDMDTESRACREVRGTISCNSPLRAFSDSKNQGQGSR
jgi:superfamily II DNA helicase RecQ